MMLIMPLVIQAIADADDRQYMEQLYTEYHRLMLSTAWTYIKSKVDVEDIVSDSCLSLLKKIDALRDMERNALRYWGINDGSFGLYSVYDSCFTEKSRHRMGKSYQQYR